MAHIIPNKRTAGTIRILRQIPETHTLFVGPVICSRHGYYANQYLHWKYVSTVTMELCDVAMGEVYNCIDEAVYEILKHKNPPPKAIMLYTGCQDCIINTDFSNIISRLKNKYSIAFAHFGKNRMFTEKETDYFPTFYQSIFTFLQPGGSLLPEINIIGSISKLKSSNELIQLLNTANITGINTIKDSSHFEKFCEMGCARLNIVINEQYIEAAVDMEQRLGIPWLLLPISYNTVEISKQYEKIATRLNCRIHTAERRNICESHISRAVENSNGRPIWLDTLGIHHPYSCIKNLISYGFNIRKITVGLEDTIKLAEESSALLWLKKHAPQLEIHHEDFQHNMPFAPEIRPLETEYFGFAAIENLSELLEKGCNKI